MSRLTSPLLPLAAVCLVTATSCEDRDVEPERPALEARIVDDQVWITTERDVLPTLARVYSNVPTVYDDGREEGPIALQVPRDVLPSLSELTHEAHDRCAGFMLHDSEAEALEAMRAPSLQKQVVAGANRIDNGETVQALLGAIKEAEVLATVKKLASYPTRHHASPTGIEAVSWIRDTWAALGKGRSDVTVALVNHTRTKQPSVSLTIRGSKLPDEHIILGGHLDSIGGRTATANAPGADDNASGIATLTEIARVALSLGYVPERSVTFYGYAAEEVGLVGSGEIAAAAKTAGKKVVGVMQLDMTNYNRSASPYIGIMTDYTDASLNQFTQKLIETYVKVPWKTDKCGYACSDHASWSQRGYPAIMPHESNMADDNKRIHTANDTLAVSNNGVTHTMNFVKLGVAYVGEMAKGTLPKAASATTP